MIEDSKKLFGPDECWCTQHGQVFYPCKKSKLCRETNEKFSKMKDKYNKSKSNSKNKRKHVSRKRKSKSESKRVSRKKPWCDDFSRCFGCKPWNKECKKCRENKKIIINTKCK